MLTEEQLPLFVSEIHQYFITNLSTQYENDCQTCLADFRRDISLKDRQAHECLNQLEGALISLNEVMEQDLIDDRVDFLKKNDENLNEHIEKCGRIKEKKLLQAKLLHEEIQSVLKDYFSTMLDPEKGLAHQKLQDQHEKSQILIHSNEAKMRELNLIIKGLQEKITTIEIAGTRKVMSKRLVKRKLLEEIDTLKWKIDRLNVDHTNRMKELSYEAYHTEKHLSKLLEKGKSILSLAQTCSKLECEDDVKYFQTRIEKGLTDGDVSEYAFLFGKINRVKAINLLLLEEKENLLKTNRELQQQFKDYCQKNNSNADVGSLQLTVKSLESVH